MRADEWIRTVDDYLERCFAQHTPPRVGELAMLRELEACTLSRRFTRATGMKLLAYMRAKKLEHAASLLATSDVPIEAIVERAGFGSRSSFFREFAETLRLTPGQFRSLQQFHS